MSNHSVSIVVQRFRQCKLLLNEEHWVTAGNDDTNSCGLLAYVSFGASATKSQVEQASQTLLNLPVLTTGLWGDKDSSTQSILSLATSPEPSSCSLVIVPQANLISKVKGKSIQYHGQIDKEGGEQLYNYLCSCIQGILLEAQCQARSEDLPQWYVQRKIFMEQLEKKSNNYNLPSTPPEELFRDDSKYSEWDERGVPTKDAEGNALTKSGIKKLNKVYEAHKKKHIKWKEEQQKCGNSATEQTSQSNVDEEAAPVEQWDGYLDETFCHFVKGSFGKRQGLEFKSDMGPFVHSFQV